jgi:hypothetical protein
MDETCASAGISRTLVSVGDNGLGSLLPSESYVSLYAGGVLPGIGSTQSAARHYTMLPLWLTGMIALEGRETGCPYERLCHGTLYSWILHS